MELLRRLLKFLGDIEEFYDCIGGIIGYQIMALELLSTSKDRMHRPSKDKFVDFHVPSGLNLLEDTKYASQAALWGIEGLSELGEIYLIGGAGDRLGLVDSDTGESLPAALLPYCGRSLLEGLIRDLQAREFLHLKIFGKQCITPVAIMTSSVKNNHEHIIAICERLEWFGRGCENFRLFEQLCQENGVYGYNLDIIKDDACVLLPSTSEPSPADKLVVVTAEKEEDSNQFWCLLLSH